MSYVAKVPREVNPEVIEDLGNLLGDRITTTMAVSEHNGHGEDLFAEDGGRSHTITCIKYILNWDIDKIHETLLSKGFRMDRGYGKLRGTAFRIAHMGNVHMEDLIEYLAEFDKDINA